MAAGQSTALQLVNAALRRLGKSQITSFTGASGDTWGGLVLDSLNEAQREVEKEHDWSTLVTSGTFSTSSRTSISYCDWRSPIGAAKVPPRGTISTSCSNASRRTASRMAATPLPSSSARTCSCSWAPGAISVCTSRSRSAS